MKQVQGLSYTVMPAQCRIGSLFSNSFSFSSSLSFASPSPIEGLVEHKNYLIGPLFRDLGQLADCYMLCASHLLVVDTRIGV